MRGDRIVLEANPGFWGGKPQWDRIIYKPIKSGPSRVAALLNGDVDMINNVPSQDIARLKKESGIVLHQEASTRVIFLISDANRDVTPFVKDKDGKQIRPNPLRDWRVRKAMSKAIDREAIVARVMQGAARSAGQIVQEGVFGHNPDVKVEPYDPEGAKDLLSQAGYGGGFNLTIQVASDRGANEVDTVEAVAQMLTRIGIKTEVMGVPNNAFIPKAKRGEWSMLLMGWTMDTAEPSGPLRLQLHSYTESLGTWNLMRYSNRRLDDVIEAALVTMDAAKRDKLFQEAAAISMRDVAWIPLYNEVNTWGSRKGVRYEARADNYTLAKKVFKAN